MKLRNDVTTNTSNFQGKEFSTSFNLEKVNLFMSILAKNYNNPELAVLREWVSNAHDSHVAAGQTRAVKVILPTKMNSMLQVQDWGLGMSFEDVKDTYSVFGGSTKDADNSGIGGFGIGGKSALALGDQYSMIAIKDGLKNIFLFERSSAGGVDVKNMLNNAPTDEPNGVTVSVSVERSHMYSYNEVSRVLGGWSANELEVSEGFDSIIDNAAKVENGYILNTLFNPELERSIYDNKTYVLVGPVLYEVSSDFLPDRDDLDEQSRYNANYYKAQRNRGLIPTIPIGSVTFPSSREVIEPTRSNREIIQKAFTNLFTDAEKLANEKIGVIANHKEALNAAKMKFVTRLGITVKFQGEVVPTSSKENGFSVAITGIQNKDFILQTEKNREVPLESIAYLIENDDALSLETLRRRVRGLVKNLSEDEFRSLQRQYIVYSKEPSSWLRHAAKKVIKVSDIPVVKSSVTLSQPRAKADVSKAIELKVLFSSKDIDKKTRTLSDVLEEKYDYVVALEYTANSRYGGGYGLDILDTVISKISKDTLVISLLTRHKMKTLKEIDPRVVSIDEYFDSIDRTELKSVKASIAKAQELAVISLSDKGVQSLDFEAFANDDLKKILAGYDNKIADGIDNLTRYFYSTSPTQQEILTKVSKKLGIPIKGQYYRNRHNSGKPFSLLGNGSYYDAANDEIKDYLNWSATRYMAKNNNNA